MEVVCAKRTKSRKKRRHAKKRRRNHVKCEVTLAKRHRSVAESCSILIAKERFIDRTMQADSFWKNYTAAQDWQKRHNITWWRSRCFALEYENQMLRDKLRLVACQDTQQGFSTVQGNQGYRESEQDEDNEEDVEEGTEFNEENENFEFHVNEEMMNFLEQSIRHKIELKQKQHSELVAAAREEQHEKESIQGGAAWIKKRNSSAKLLYGESSPTILAMETALQTTVDRHKDKAKPQYWPVIPLKP